MLQNLCPSWCLWWSYKSCYFITVNGIKRSAFSIFLPLWVLVVFLAFLFFKGLFNNENWIYECDLLLWLLVTFASIFAILGTVHPNQFCNSAQVPIVFQDSIKAEPLTNISPHQETVNLSSVGDLQSWALTATHKAFPHVWDFFHYTLYCIFCRICPF